MIEAYATARRAVRRMLRELELDVETRFALESFQVRCTTLLRLEKERRVRAIPHWRSVLND